MEIPLTLDRWLIAFAAMLIAGLVQSNIGFGLSLVAAPVLVLISPDLVPGPIMAVSTLFMVRSAWKFWNKVDRSSLAWGAVSRVPGTLLGGVALAYLPTSGINILFGLLVLLAVVLSLIGLRVEITHRTILLAGGLSGFMSTVAAIGGPPLALIFQHSAPDEIRANLAAHFSVGGVISLMMLAGIGKFGLPELTAALWLVPGTALGYALGPWTSRYLDRRARPAVLLFVAASAVVVLAREL